MHGFAYSLNPSKVHTHLISLLQELINERRTADLKVKALSGLIHLGKTSADDGKVGEVITRAV